MITQGSNVEKESLTENRQNPVVVEKPLKAGFRGFTLQLFLIIILPITVLLLVVVFGSQRLHHEAMRDLVGDRDLKTVQANADSLGHEIAHLKSFIQVLALSLNQGANLEGVILPVQENTRTFDGGIALLGADGEFFQSTESRLDWRKLSEQYKEYFLSVQKAGNQPLLSSLILPSASEVPIFLISVLTRDNNILAGAFSPENLILETIGDLVNSGEASYLVISPSALSDGYFVIFQGGTPLIHAGPLPHPGVQEVLSGESGIIYLHPGHGEHVVAYSPIPSSDWGIIIE